MIPLLITRQKAYKSRRDCHWNHTVRTLENHITLLFFLSGYTVWLRHFISTCYCSSICPASPNSVIWGRENARGVREQLLCELVLFFRFVLRQGLPFWQLEPWSEPLTKVPISSVYLTETSWGTDAQHCSWLPYGPRGMISGCWVFIADSSVLPTQLSPWTGPNLHFLTTLHFVCCHVPFLPEKLFF